MLILWGAGIYPASLLTATAILCSGTALILFFSNRSSGKLEEKRPVPATALSFISLIILLLVSALPLTGRMDILTGSKRSTENQLVKEAIQQADDLGLIQPRTVLFAMTRNRSGTYRIIFLAFAMLSAATLTALLPGQWKTRYLRLLILLVTAFAVAGFLHQWVLPKEQSLWWHIPTSHGRPIACFMSRTHYAGFIGMFCPMALAFFISRVSQKKWLCALPYGMAFAVMSFVVVMSLARGAVVTAGIASVAVLVFSLRKCSPRTGITILVCASITFSALGLAAYHLPKENIRSEVSDRLKTLTDPWSTTSGAMRMSLWTDSLKVWRSHPLTGVGADGFQMVYPQYRTRTDRFSFNHTENQYLQLLVDGGVLGVLLVLIFLFTACKRWKANNMDGSLPEGLSMAVTGAVLAAAIHNAIDFPLYVPLYAIVLASIVGLVLSPPVFATAPGSRKGISMSPLASALCLDSVSLIIIIIALACGTKPYELDDPNILKSSDPEVCADAMIYSPTSWYAWHCFGTAAFRGNTRETMAFGNQCLTQATKYDKYNYLLWESVGYARLNMWDHEGAREAFERMKKLRPWKKIPKLEERRY